MINTSTTYKEKIILHRDEAVRHQFHTELYFGLIDNTAKDDISKIETSPMLPISSIDNVINNTSDTTKYATFENGYGVLGNTERWQPNNNQKTHGFISQDVSDENGQFEEEPFIDVFFNERHSFVGTTINFDTTAPSPPKKFTILGFQNGVEVDNHVIDNNEEYSLNIVVGFDEIDEFKITFQETAEPYQRVRVTHFSFGIGYVFTDEKTMSISHDREAHPLNLSLPVNKLSFSIENIEDAFDIDADLSLTRFLSEGQAITFKYGYDVSENGDNSVIEWFNVGEYYLSSWSISGIEAKFVARDIIYMLSEATFDKGTWANDPLAIDYAKRLLDDFGTEKYYADDVRLRNYYIPNAFIIDTYANLLQSTAMISSTFLTTSQELGVTFRNLAISSPDTWYVIKPSFNTEEMTVESNLQSVVATPNENIVYASFEREGCVLGEDQYWKPANDADLLTNTGVAMNAFPLNETEYLHYWWRVDLRENMNFGGIYFRFQKNTVKRLEIMLSRAVHGGADLVHRMYVDVNGAESIEWRFSANEIVWVQVRIADAMSENIRPRLLGMEIQAWTGFEFSTDDVLNKPTEYLEDPVRNVTTSYFPGGTVSFENAVVCEATIDSGKVYKLTHSAMIAPTGIVSTDTVGAVIEQADVYANVSYVKISGVENAVVKVTGNIVHANDFGTATSSLQVFDIEKENDANIEPLHGQWPSSVNLLLSTAKDYYSNRNIYEFECLGFPELEAGDVVKYKGRYARVLKNNITLKGGAMRGKMKLRGVESNSLHIL